METNTMRPILLLFPKSLMKSFNSIDELPLSYKHLTKGRQFTVGQTKLRAVRKSESTPSVADFRCFQFDNNDQPQLVSSSLETFSFVQDLTTPSECIPKPVIFRPDYPSNLRIRCQPFGADDPKSSPSVERHHKKSKKEKKRKRLKTEYDDN